MTKDRLAEIEKRRDQTFEYMGPRNHQDYLDAEEYRAALLDERIRAERVIALADDAIGYLEIEMDDEELCATVRKLRARLQDLRQ